MSEIIKTIEYKGFKADITAEPLYYDNPLVEDCYWSHMNFFAYHKEYNLGQEKYRNLYTPSDFNCGAEAVRSIKSDQDYIYHTFIGCENYRYGNLRLYRVDDTEAENGFTGFIWITREQYKNIKEQYKGVEGLDLRKVEEVCNRYVEDMLEQYLYYINGIFEPRLNIIEHTNVEGFSHYVDDYIEFSKYSCELSGELYGEAFEEEVHKYIDTNLAELNKELNKAIDINIERLKGYKQAS